MSNVKDLVVTKSATLVNARYFMPLGAQKLMCLGAAKFKEEDVTERGITVDIYADELNQITGNQNKYEDLRNYSNQLFESEFFIQGEGKKYIRKRITHKVEYIEDEARVKLSFDSDVIPFLITIKDRAIKYLVDATSSFHNNYSLRFFELLVQHINDDQIEYDIYFPLDELRKTLILENKYSKFADLKRYVLLVVVDELNETQEINNLVMHPVKQGRRAIGLRFTFTSE